MRKQNKRRKQVITVIAIIIVVALVLTYVLQITALASSTPPPDQPPDTGYGTDWGQDDSTLPAPWEDDEEDVALPDLRILTGAFSLNVGERAQIQYVFENFPEGTVLEWRTSNPDVAIVSSDGVVMAMAPGEVDVIVIAGDKRQSVYVRVNLLKAGSIAIEIIDKEGLAKETGRKEYKLVVGDVIKLRAKILPEGAKVEKISWAVGDDTVASIPGAQLSSKECDFVAGAIGKTTVTVTADGMSDKITINIEESGVSMASLMDYIRYGVIITIVAIAAAVVLTWLSQQRKKAKARAKAEAKRRRAEAERRAREESERREKDRDKRNTRPLASDGRQTFKASGTLVGAGVSAPPDSVRAEPERPVTLDDLD